MDNKDQLNQIPGDANENQDEKTSQTENQKVEASQQSEEIQKVSEEKSETESPTTSEAEVVQETPQQTVEEPKPVESEKVEEEMAVEDEKADVAEKAIPETAVEEPTVEAELSEVPAEPQVEEEVQAAAEDSEKKEVADETSEEVKPEVVAEKAEVPAEPQVEEEVQAAAEDSEKEEVADETSEEVKPEVVSEKAEVPAEPQVGEEVQATAEDSEKEEVADEPSEETKAEVVAEEAEETPTAEVEGEVAEKPAVAAEAGSDETEEEAKKATPVADAEEEAVEKTSETPAGEDESHDGDHDEDEDEDEHEIEEDVDYETLSREGLIEQLGELVAAEDINSIKSKVSQIKVSYLKKTKADKEAKIDETLKDEAVDNKTDEPVEDPLEIKFNELFDIYKQKRVIFLENLEKQKVENLQKKKDILDELKELISSEETLKKTYDDFKALQERWKDIGMVPKSEVNNLWQNYHFLVEKFFDKVKINKELKDLDLKKNLEQKIELCEKAEELLLENSIIRSFKELQRYHEQWKEIGPVPTDKNEDLWERFKSTTDKINQRRRDHYKQLQDQHENNYEAKVGLCEKAEELLATEVNSIREWQNKTKQFNELFKVWKTIGPAMKKQNDEIWERFKATLDAFFKDKKEYFAKLKEQQINNYNLKLDLCVRAEAVKDSDDWKQTTRELINLQSEWKQVGPVPRKHSDKIWKRFRAACDEFFNRKSNHFSHIREEEITNLNKKEELIKLVTETEFGEDRSENLNKLKDFQRQWTEIGFVPFKDKDRLQNAFRNAVNVQLDKLNISNSEISIENYKSKMEVLKGSSDGNRSLSRERNFIQGKINQLRDDVHVWENNIGFLANSKKASLFKDEFEKKIEKARKELEVLEAKLKFLDQ